MARAAAAKARTPPWRARATPLDAYLDMRRVSRNPEVVERFYTDPLGRRSYPLALLAGMLCESVTRSVPCPVTVVAATGDTLFSLPYTRAVFDRIQAPAKELVVVEAAEHLVFTEASRQPGSVPRGRASSKPGWVLTRQRQVAVGPLHLSEESS